MYVTLIVISGICVVSIMGVYIFCVVLQNHINIIVKILSNWCAKPIPPEQFIVVKLLIKTLSFSGFGKEILGEQSYN